MSTDRLSTSERMLSSATMGWQELLGSSVNEVLVQQEIKTDRQENDSRNDLFFIFFCIACVAFLGVFLAAYVYWGIR
jgi:hypothetical protein